MTDLVVPPPDGVTVTQTPDGTLVRTERRWPLVTLAFLIGAALYVAFSNPEWSLDRIMSAIFAAWMLAIFMDGIFGEPRLLLQSDGLVVTRRRWGLFLTRAAIPWTEIKELEKSDSDLVVVRSDDSRHRVVATTSQDIIQWAADEIESRVPRE